MMRRQLLNLKGLAESGGNYRLASLPRSMALTDPANVSTRSRRTCSPSSSSASQKEGGRHRRDQPRHRRSGHAHVPAHRRRRLQSRRADPDTHQYPSNRGRQEFRDAFAASTTAASASRSIPTGGDPRDRRQGGHLQPLPVFLDPGDVALGTDPGYPVYTGGPLLADAEPFLLPITPEIDFMPDLDSIPTTSSRKRAPAVPQLPEQPDRRGGPGRASSSESSSLLASTRSSSCTTTPTRRPLRRLRRAELPRHARRQGGRGRDVLALQGLEHDRLALAAILGNADASAPSGGSRPTSTQASSKPSSSPAARPSRARTCRWPR